MYTILSTSLITVLFLIMVNRRLYLRCNLKDVNVWLLHPLFLFNSMVILTFFIPYLFHLYFGTIKRNLDLTTTGNIRDLVIICFIFFFISLLWYTGDLFAKRSKINSSKSLIFAKKGDRAVQLFTFIFCIVVFFQILYFLRGQYSAYGLIAGKGGNVSLAETGIIGFFSVAMAKFAWIGLSLLYFTKFSKNKKFKVLFWFLVILNIIFFFLSGSKAKILMPVLLFTFCWLIFLKRNFVRSILIGTVLLAMFFAFYNVYRGFAARTLRGEVSVGYTEYLSERWLIKEKGYFFFVANSFVSRLESFSGYLLLTDSYPDIYPFLKGDSYTHLLLSPIPRAIIPWKPVAVSANVIGRKTGIIANDNYVTTPGIAWWGEAYINFGYWGIFFVLLVVAAFYQCLFSFWIKHHKSIVITAVYIFFLLYIVFGFHGGIGGVFGTFIKFLVVITPIALVIYTPRLTDRRDNENSN